MPPACVASKSRKPRASRPGHLLIAGRVQLEAGIDKVLQGRQCAGFRLCVEFGELSSQSASDNLLMVDDQLRHYGGDERLQESMLSSTRSWNVYLKKLSTGLLSS